MDVKASLNNLRLSPRKTRLVVGLLRGLGVAQAEAQLQFMAKRSAMPLLKLVRSAVANAEHNFSLTKSDLYIKTMTVDEGVSLKRWMPRAQGRATPIKKRSCHVNLVLSEIGEVKPKKLK